MKGKKKIIYEEEIFPARFSKLTGALLVFSRWIIQWDLEVVNMPVIILQWIDDKNHIVAMTHQSLQ